MTILRNSISIIYNYIIEIQSIDTCFYIDMTI